MKWNQALRTTSAAALVLMINSTPLRAEDGDVCYDDPLLTIYRDHAGAIQADVHLTVRQEGEGRVKPGSPPYILGDSSIDRVILNNGVYHSKRVRLSRAEEDRANHTGALTADGGEIVFTDKRYRILYGRRNGSAWKDWDHFFPVIIASKSARFVFNDDDGRKQKREYNLPQSTIDKIRRSCS